MRRLYVFLLFAISQAVFAQYTVSIHQRHWALQHNVHEWEGKLYAELKFNGVAIDTSDYSCEWWRTRENTNTWETAPFWPYFWNDREGLNTSWWKKYLVKVYANGNLIATSDVVQITAPPQDGKIVYFSWEDGNGAPINSGVSVHYWSTPSDWHPGFSAVPGSGDGNRLQLRTAYPEVVQARPDMLINTNQRFHSWSPQTVLEENGHFNHIQASVTTSNVLVSVRYRANQTGSTLQSILVDNSGASGATVAYKDPWLVDTTDSQYKDGNKGYRNLALGALFKNEASPLQPSLSNKYKGVFLNQSIVPGQPYYSVRARKDTTINGITWKFLNWDTSGVTMTLPGTETSGYYEAPVVFRNWGSRTVTANYKAHLASNAASVLAANGQRRLAAGVTSNPDHLLVYHSANKIWSSYKTGVVWGAENGGNCQRSTDN